MNKITEKDLANVEQVEILGTKFNIYGTNEEPLFLAQDIAEMIEYSPDKVGQMLENVDDDEKLTDTIYRSGQAREMWFLTEYGLYELLMQSRKPLAKKFKVEVKKTLYLMRTGQLKVNKPISHGAGTLLIENARILFRNFTGVKTKYNSDRNFCVVIDDEGQAQSLLRDGWNIKTLAARDEGDNPTYYVQVTVRFDNIPPKVFMITRKNKVQLDEKTIGSLDFAEIGNVDLTINPSSWNDDDGCKRIKAYLKNMYVTINEDLLSEKYAD